MSNEGFIVILRKLLDWEWYQDSKMVHLLIHCIMKANFEAARFQGTEVKRGQFISGIPSLAAQTGISFQSVRTCLEKLKQTGEITIQSTNRFSIITVCNYETYQNLKVKSNKPSNIQATGNQHSTNIPSTTSNELNNENELKQELHALQLLIKNNYPLVSQMKTQITFKNCEEIVKKFKMDIITETLDSMENKIDLTKKYSSVYLTLNKWCKNNNATSTKERSVPHMIKNTLGLDK